MARHLVPLSVALVLGAIPACASAETGGTAYVPVPAPQPAAPPPFAPTTSAPSAVLLAHGVAVAPRSAPAAVKLAIAAANKLQHLRYRWGGGHASFTDKGYDCSGSVSFLLHGGGLLASPLDSTGLMKWGLPGPGRWITVYANARHTYAVVAGLRLDTSGGPGPRWHVPARSNAGFAVRHPAGL